MQEYHSLQTRRGNGTIDQSKFNSAVGLDRENSNASVGIFPNMYGGGPESQSSDQVATSRAGYNYQQPVADDGQRPMYRRKFIPEFSARTSKVSSVENLEDQRQQNESR